MFKIHVLINGLNAHNEFADTLTLAAIRAERLANTAVGRMGEVVVLKGMTNERVWLEERE